ncbi:MAG: cyclophilin-like fold protein [Candidatus Bathyarchaeia archaeon]
MRRRTTEKSVSRVTIRLKVEGLGEAKGELIRYLAPRTVDAITRILPLEGRAALWKNEVYFEIPIKMGEEKPKNTVQKGTLAYWPMGKAFCIFYSDAQPYSSVNIIGQITENTEVFSQIKSGTKIRVERI